MRCVRLYCCCIATLCLAIASAASEKQIKLEDIEKDTLKAAQQTKYEKQIQQQQLQQQQQQQQQYQQITYQYDPQAYTQQNVAYQTPTSSYSQYFIPQQYLPQTVLSGFVPLSSNSLGSGYAASSSGVFPTYLNTQLSIPSASSFHAGQQIAAATQTQPIIMAFTAPTLAAFQQQPYYQGALQYYPTQTAQPTQFYYTSPAADQTSSSQLSSSVVYPSTQQYITSYQPTTANKATTSLYTQQYVSTAPQTFAAQTYPTQAEYSSYYSPQAYSSNSIYSNTETPTFVTVKVPQHLVASQGQQQQYIQANPTTISPLQAKYLNSPQYLAQNYNTIQSSHLYSKGALSSGVKSTVSPPLKTPSGGSFSNSFGSSSSSVSSYLPFKSLPPSKSI